MKKVCFLILVLAFFATPAMADGLNWTELDTGLEYATARMADDGEDGLAHFLRIDPEAWKFVLLTSKESGRTMTARQWVRTNHLVAGINAGMFQEDKESNVGYMQSPTAVNWRGVNAYRSVFAFAARKEGIPKARMFDLDETEFNAITDDYAGVIQNLRLIKRPGENRWTKQDKRWSEAALAEDDHGRILFIFLRAPMTMRAFNEKLLSLPLGIHLAHHLEGGPEATFVIDHPKKQLTLFGSHDATSILTDLRQSPWPIPNLLGIEKR